MSKSRAERSFAVQGNARKMKGKEIDAGDERREKWKVHIRYVHPLSIPFIHSFTRHMDEIFSLG
jgi:hypothetical protein